MIRGLTLGDRAAIEAMTRGVRLFREDEIPVALEVFDGATHRRTDAPNDSGYESAGAEVNGRLVGWSCWGPTPCTLGTFDLYWIVVDAAWQGRGIGGALLAAMERRIAGRARLVVVETAGRPDYAATRAFYVGHGYRAVSTIPDFYAPGDDRITFVKTFPALEQT